MRISASILLLPFSLLLTTPHLISAAPQPHLPSVSEGPPAETRELADGLIMKPGSPFSSSSSLSAGGRVSSGISSYSSAARGGGGISGGRGGSSGGRGSSSSSSSSGSKGGSGGKGSSSSSGLKGGSGGKGSSASSGLKGGIGSQGSVGSTVNPILSYDSAAGSSGLDGMGWRVVLMVGALGVVGVGMGCL